MTCKISQHTLYILQCMISCIRKIKKDYKPDLYFKHHEPEGEHSAYRKPYFKLHAIMQNPSNPYLIGSLLTETLAAWEEVSG